MISVVIDNPGDELDSLSQASVEKCVECIERNRDMIVGIKVRLGKMIACRGRNEQEAYRLAANVVKTILIL